MEEALVLSHSLRGGPPHHEDKGMIHGVGSIGLGLCHGDEGMIHVVGNIGQGLLTSQQTRS